MTSANLAARFALEIATLVALGYAGWQLGPGAAGRILLAVAAPATFAIVWGLLVSPKAPRRLPDPARLGVEVVLFGAAAAALAAAGARVLAAVLAAAVAANLALMVVWDQRGH